MKIKQLISSKKRTRAGGYLTKKDGKSSKSLKRMIEKN
jgi:hypothetical protein